MNGQDSTGPNLWELKRIMEGNTKKIERKWNQTIRED